MQMTDVQSAMLDDLFALIAASQQLDRIAAQRGIQDRSLSDSRKEARRALFSAADMRPDHLAVQLDSRISERPAPRQRALICAAGIQPLRPDRWTPELEQARRTLHGAVRRVLNRIDRRNQLAS